MKKLIHRKSKQSQPVGPTASSHQFTTVPSSHTDSSTSTKAKKFSSHEFSSLKEQECKYTQNVY